MDLNFEDLLFTDHSQHTHSEHIVCLHDLHQKQMLETEFRAVPARNMQFDTSYENAMPTQEIGQEQAKTPDSGLPLTSAKLS